VIILKKFIKEYEEEINEERSQRSADAKTVREIHDKQEKRIGEIFSRVLDRAKECIGPIGTNPDAEKAMCMLEEVLKRLVRTHATKRWCFTYYIPLTNRDGPYNEENLAPESKLLLSWLKKLKINFRLGLCRKTYLTFSKI